MKDNVEKKFMEQLNEWIKKVQPLNQTAYDDALAYMDTLTKPQGSLGRLELLAAQLSGIRGAKQPSVHPAAVVVMAADHGIAQAGVSAYPQEVTAQMVLNFMHGGAAINVFARQIHAEVTVVDLGVACDVEQLVASSNELQVMKESDVKTKLEIRKIRYGTANMLEQPAMTREEALQAILTGIEVAETAIARGALCIIPGEMGIGNTTSSSAIVALMEDKTADEVTGPGTGVIGEHFARKRALIQQVMERHRPKVKDGLDVLASVGGLEIAGLVGLIIGAAAFRVPILLDGFICGAAAIIARDLCPNSEAYMIAGHQSQEPGHQVVLDLLGKQPLLKLDLRLGEGSGAALAYPLLEAACRMIGEMATFEKAGVSNK